MTFAKTGVKWTHHAAKKYDIGIYFEANGHGTVLVKDECISRFRQVGWTQLFQTLFYLKELVYCLSHKATVSGHSR